jgi:hypothetical protein
MASAWSISAVVMVSGGKSVSTLPKVVLKLRPLEAGVEHGLCRVGGRLLGRAVVDQIDAEQQAEAAHVADQRVSGLELPQPPERVGADLCGAGDQALVLDDLELRPHRGDQSRVA